MKIEYDYINQLYVKDGKIEPCDHPESMRPGSPFFAKAKPCCDAFFLAGMDHQKAVKTGLLEPSSLSGSIDRRGTYDRRKNNEPMTDFERRVHSTDRRADRRQAQLAFYGLDIDKMSQKTTREEIQDNKKE